MKKIKSILWRKINKSTFDTLKGISSGQYDIRLGTNITEDFISGLDKSNFTEKGGFNINIQLDPYDDLLDPNLSVSESSLILRFMGDASSRKDWNIPSQRPDTAYELWKPSRRLPDGLPTNSYLCIVRAEDDTFHARLILDDEFENLPLLLQQNMSKSEAGCMPLNKLTPSSESIKIYDLLMKKYNVLLYGPPGTGKTTLIQEVINIFNNGGYRGIEFDETKEINPFVYTGYSQDDNKTIWTTFHQNYTYEDFILGLTTGNSTDKVLDINPKPGVLLELSEFARQSNKRSLLVIDELNRGNVSRIFGEFITLIEPDKRLNDNNLEINSTIKLRLPHVKIGDTIKFKTEEGSFTFSNPFTMPKQVYTLASMNSIDKSIVPLDSALRRRFYRYDIMPDLDLLAEKFNINTRNINNPTPDDMSEFTVNDIRNLAWMVLKTLNKKITLFLGKDYTLGHSYFWPLSNDYTDVTNILDELISLFIEQIYPQLEEIFRSKQYQLDYILKLNEVNTSKLVFNIIEPTEDELDLGASPSISFNIDSFNSLNAIKWFQSISEIDII